MAGKATVEAAALAEAVAETAVVRAASEPTAVAAETAKNKEKMTARNGAEMKNADVTDRR